MRAKEYDLSDSCWDCRQYSFPRPACRERATRAERKPDLGPVRGRFHELRLAERPPHPDLLHSPSQTGVNALMARGEKEHAVHAATQSIRIDAKKTQSEVARRDALPVHARGLERARHVAPNDH